MILDPCVCGQPAVYHPYGQGGFVQCTGCNRYGDEAVFGKTEPDATEAWNRHRRLDRLAAEKVKEWAAGRPVDERMTRVEYTDNGVIVTGGARHHPGYRFKLVVEEK